MQCHPGKRSGPQQVPTGEVGAAPPCAVVGVADQAVGVEMKAIKPPDVVHQPTAFLTVTLAGLPLPIGTRQVWTTASSLCGSRLARPLPRVARWVVSKNANSHGPSMPINRSGELALN